MRISSHATRAYVKRGLEISLVLVISLMAVGAFGLYIFQRPPGTNVLLCQHGEVYGHTIVSYITTNGTTIQTGGFNTLGTITASFTTTMNSMAEVGGKTTIKIDLYPGTATCSYVPA